MKERKEQVSAGDDKKVVQQATEEQIRYAKLSQMNSIEDCLIQEKIKEVSEITQKSTDVVSLALHDANYDTSVAICFILEGRYDGQDDWQTTATRKNKKLSQTINDKPAEPDGFQEQKSSKRRDRNRSKSRGSEEKTSNNEIDRFDLEKDFSWSNNDSGRGRGRGRRGGRGRGGRGGGRGGASFRGYSRGGKFNSVGRGGKQSHNNRDKDNGWPDQENWDVDFSKNKAPSNAKKEIKDKNLEVEEDWEKPQEEAELKCQPEEEDWAKENCDTWANSDPQYIPENIDTAIICSIPTSSTCGEVTSYQHTNDISRYIATAAASNQFPSSHQEGGLVGTLSERIANKIEPTNQPIVSGVTEMHKLEEEQLSRPPPVVVPPVTTAPQPRKSRKAHKLLPSEPVVMPRTAPMVADIQEQLSGLEFGSLRSPSPSLPLPEEEACSSTPESVHECSESAESSVDEDSPDDNHLNDVISQPPPPREILRESPPTVHQISVHTTKSEVPKTPPGFKPLNQQPSHFMGSPGRLSSHIVPEPIPFPSSSHTEGSSLNVFARNGGLGTSMATTRVSSVSFKTDGTSYRESQKLAEQLAAEQAKRAGLENQREQTIADQRAFAEAKNAAKQKMLERQLLLDESSKIRASEEKRAISDQIMAMGDATIKSATSASAVNNTPLAHPPGVVPPSLNNNMLGLTSATSIQTSSKLQEKTASHSGGPHMNPYPQPGMLPAYQHQTAVPSYNYDELLQLQRMPVSPFQHYDMPFIQPQAGVSTREAIQQHAYQGTDAKFTRAGEDSVSSSVPQAAAHMSSGSMPPGYMNTGQIPYGYFAYQPPGIMPQFTNPYQVTGGKAPQQYPPQYPQSVYTNNKYSGSEYAKQSYHGNTGMVQNTAHAKPHNSTSTSNHSSAHSAFKTQYNQQESNKSFLAQQQQQHVANINHYMMQQQMQQHQQQQGQMSHQPLDSRAAPPPGYKKEKQQASYQSFWSATR